MIEVKNLCKEFKIQRKKAGLKGTIQSLFSQDTVIKKAVSDISFQIDEGEMVGYIGNNGAGKSTTIKMMTGILVPSSGSCMVNGIEPYKNRIQNAKQIGAVFGQRTQLWWDLPLTETYTVLKEIYQVSDADFKKRMEFIYDVLSINEFEQNTVRTLSLGQRMRADLGAALLHNPKVLYLDEPTIGLDVMVKDKIRSAIKDMNQNFKTTIILTTHDLMDIEELCKHIIIIDEGRKIYDGTLDNLKAQYGAITLLEMEVDQIGLMNEVDFYKAFPLEKGDLSIHKDGSVLKIHFCKDKIGVSHLVAYVMNYVNVRDIKIQETNLLSIVKQIYLDGVNKG